MKLPGHLANASLAALIRGSGYPSLEQFAVAVNAKAWHLYGIKLGYDHISVKRWLAGGTPQHADIVAAVLGEAWGIPIPVPIIWPDQRQNVTRPAAHLQPWVAARTLEELGYLTRSDMLSRRELLNGSMAAASGAAFVEPLARWLRADVVGLDAAGLDRPGRIGLDTVTDIEATTRYFAACEAATSGSVNREPAVGLLKHAVDLAAHASYSEHVGNRLLAAIAELSGMVGWMCNDSGLHGPAQRYLVYGLQAARESSDPRGPLLVISILSDMARHMRLRGRPKTALRLLDLALDQLPADRQRGNRLRAMLWGQKGWALSCLGVTCLPEVRNSLQLAQDVHALAEGDDDWQLHRVIDTSDAEVATTTAASYLNLAREDSRLAAEAEAATLYLQSHRPAGYTKNDVVAQIRLASIRFVAGEPDQACADGEQALMMANGLRGSEIVRSRLRELAGDAAAYRGTRVRELRERLAGV
jgi:hypothetical protein